MCMQARIHTHASLLTTVAAASVSWRTAHMESHHQRAMAMGRTHAASSDAKADQKTPDDTSTNHGSS